MLGGGVRSQNLATHSKDVVWQIRKEGDVASAEGVGKKESLEIGAGEGGNFPASAVEVGADGIFVFEFPCGQINITCLRTDLGGRDA